MLFSQIPNTTVLSLWGLIMHRLMVNSAVWMSILHGRETHLFPYLAGTLMWIIVEEKARCMSILL